MKHTQSIARFIARTKFEDLPKPAVNRAKLIVVDAIGNILAAYGTKHKLLETFFNLILESGGNREATILGLGEKTTCLDAAMVNAVLADFLDFSDGHNFAGHINDGVIPVAFSVGEREKANGKELLTSVVLAYEVYIRFGYAMFQECSTTYLKTPSFQALDPVAAVVPAARLLRLGEREVAGAFAFASSIQNLGFQFIISGGSEKDFFRGHAVRRAILSALLARRGILGSIDILEGERGFCQAITETFDAKKLIEGLGKIYRIDECYFKAYPSCRFTHASIEASKNLLRDYDFDVNDIEKVTVKTNRASAKIANYNIKSHINAIFSHQYQVATVLKEMDTDLPTNWRKKLQDAKIRDLIKKVYIEIDPALDKIYQTSFGTANFGATVTIQMKGGETCESTVIYPRGDPQNMMTKEDLLHKFRRSAKKVLTNEEANSIIKLTNELEKLEDIRELINLCAPQLEPPPEGEPT